MKNLIFVVPVLIAAQILTSNTLPISDFHPFGISEGDSALLPNDDEATQVNFATGEKFQFLNVTYSHLFVNNNGGLSFSSGVTRFTPTCGPLSQPMIVPFWADVDTTRGGTVHYRESMDRQQLKKVGTEVSNAYPDQSPITLAWSFVVTWDNVAFFGAGSSCGGISKRNTFQVVLAKDGYHSFVIFNFHKITWTTGTASNGSECGLGGTPAKSGFDLGDSTTFYTVPGSCSQSIINITQTSNVGVPGKWIFRIDDQVVSAVVPTPGPASQSQLAVRCVNVTSDRIRVHPNMVPMLGRKRVTLSGPCLLEAISVQCIFNDPHTLIVPATRVNGTESSVHCKLPYLATEGKISVTLSVKFNRSRSGGQNEVRNYTGFMYTFMPKVDLRYIIREERSTLDRAFIDVSWNPERFREVPQGSRYKFDLVTLSSRTVSWMEKGTIKQLNTNCVDCPERYMASRGRFQGFADNSRILSEIRSSYFVRLIVDPPAGARGRRQRRQVPKLSTDFLHSSYNQSDEWFNRQCLQWHRMDVGPPVDVLPCPPTLNQAIVDQNFMMDRTGARDGRRRSGQFTFRQRLPSPSGSEQQCTYQDGEVLLARHRGGSAALKSSVGLRGAVNHLMADIMPWYWCCAYSSEDPRYCDLYYEKRPSHSGQGYVSRIPASGKGDPHLTTFDGLNYTFNGIGEFWMIKPKNGSNFGTSLQVQCRMEQFTNLRTNLTTNASIFTAFAFRESSSNLSSEINVQVSLSPSRSGLEVFVNSEQIPTSIPISDEDDDDEDVELPDEISIVESGVSIDYNANEGSVIILFSSGFSFDISTKDNRSLVVIASHSGSTDTDFFGLLGNGDGDSNNDLTDPDGTIVPATANIQTIHFNFGTKWRTTQNSSIFHYKAGESHDGFQRIDFRPNFNPPNLSSIPENILTLCQNSEACLFDYMNTGGDEIFALQTLQSEIRIRDIVQVSENSVEVCETPPAPEHGWYNFTNYLVGSKVTLCCDKGHVPVSDYQFTCIHPEYEDDEDEGVDELKPRWNFTAIPGCVNKSRIWTADWFQEDYMIFC